MTMHIHSFFDASTRLFSMEKRRGSFSFLKKLLAEHVEHSKLILLVQAPSVFDGKAAWFLQFSKEIA